jgi:hypothetical protein
VHQAVGMLEKSRHGELLRLSGPAVGL